MVHNKACLRLAALAMLSTAIAMGLSGEALSQHRRRDGGYYDGYGRNDGGYYFGPPQRVNPYCANCRLDYSTGYYVGETYNNVRQGYGTFVSADGSIYEGNWRNDRLDGQGIMTLTNGYKYEGAFSNGKQNGWGRVFLPNGQIEQHTYVNGNLVQRSVERQAQTIQQPQPRAQPAPQQSAEDARSLEKKQCLSEHESKIRLQQSCSQIRSRAETTKENTYEGYGEMCNQEFLYTRKCKLPIAEWRDW